MNKWTAADVPDQSRRTVVTGANSGLGLAVTKEFARTGATAARLWSVSADVTDVTYDFDAPATTVEGTD